MLLEQIAVPGDPELSVSVWMCLHHIVFIHFFPFFSFFFAKVGAIALLNYYKIF